MAVRGALLLFCGLPAAGKSCLARRLLAEAPGLLLQHLACRGVRAVRVWHVCFDAVEEALRLQRGVEAFDPVLWRESRDLVLASVRAFFAAAEPRLDLPCAVQSSACGNESEACMQVLVLDDNMHYRSMRRTYYNLAREAQIAVCTLGLPISLELALARNAQRPPAQRVADATIRTMVETLQWPQPDRQGWERGWLRLAEPEAPPLPPQEASPQQAPADEPQLEPQPVPWPELAAALVESVPSGPTEAERSAMAEAAAASAAQTAASAAHQLDLRLRKGSGQLMQQLAALPAAERSALARAMSELKKQVLQSRKERWAQRGPPAELEEELEAACDELEAAFALARTHPRPCEEPFSSSSGVHTSAKEGEQVAPAPRLEVNPPWLGPARRPPMGGSGVRALCLFVAGVAARSTHQLQGRTAVHETRPAAASACGEPDACAVALRLRGGDAASMLEGAKSSYLGVPIVTRVWSSVIVSLALLSQIGVPPELLQLDGALIVKKLQLWRLITSASFFGGIGAQLLQKMYYLVSFGTALESTIGAGEYLRVVVSCTACHAFLFHLLGWQFLGEGLVMAITVLFAQLSPAGAQMSLYGLKIPYPLLPFAQLAMSYIFTQQVPYQDIAGLFVGYLHYFMNDNLKPDDAVQLPVAAKKGGRASGAGDGKPRRKGRKARVTMNMAASSS